MTLPEFEQNEINRLTTPAPVPRAVTHRNEKFAHARAIARGEDAQTPLRSGTSLPAPQRSTFPVAEVARLLGLYEKGR